LGSDPFNYCLVAINPMLLRFNYYLIHKNFDIVDYSTMLLFFNKIHLLDK